MDRSAALKAAVLRSMVTGEYSDLKIKCQYKTFDVHKAIVCFQSKWFANAVKEDNFKEGRSSIVELPEDSVHTVNGMVSYLYSSDYSCPTEKDIDPRSQSRELPPKMLFHLQMYGLSDRLFIEGLKDLSLEKFKNLAERDWNSEVFPDAIRQVYEVTPPGSHGVRLRSIVVKIAATNSQTILVNGKSFCATMEEVPEFGKDLFQVMAGGTIALSPLTASEYIKLQCPVCTFQFFANAQSLEEIACPSCTARKQHPTRSGSSKLFYRRPVFYSEDETSSFLPMLPMNEQYLDKEVEFGDRDEGVSRARTAETTIKNDESSENIAKQSFLCQQSEYLAAQRSQRREHLIRAHGATTREERERRARKAKVVLNPAFWNVTYSIEKSTISREDLDALTRSYVQQMKSK
ncbi:hypothetical protein G7Y89_g10654 [Cudoniella acicularis]|uniref:BTB domain-containing protein n=1 Tax=Cudoniella acicularis TaxID=354080 RepID=A0A8H4RF26_9HELO|nr:hypothetical protein G7Y89_g10654 [Cudoniella acicularis]